MSTVSLHKQIRTDLMNHLWHGYKKMAPQVQCIEQALLLRGNKPVLDHCAIIDLPSAKTGISVLSQIFSALGYLPQGRDYLSDKQNEFMWMVEADATGKKPADVLPQVVVADFWLDELPLNIRNIIEKYTRHITHTILNDVQKLSGLAFHGDAQAAATLTTLLKIYFSKRDWPLPSVADFQAVHEANELLAWTLAFGRQPNHFTISAHLLPGFVSLTQFNKFITGDLALPLNEQGGEIKGSAAVGIEQSSTLGEKISVKLADGAVDLPGYFVEFVWRYPKLKNQKPVNWNDYFTGFIPANANKVIESLYTQSAS